MDLLTPLVNAYPMLVLTVLVVFYMRGRFDQLKSEIRAVRQEGRDNVTNLRQEVRDLRSEMNRRFEQQGAEIAGLRSDLTHVALALGARTRPEAGSA